MLILRAIDRNTLNFDKRQLRTHIIINCLKLYPEFVTYFSPRAHQLPRPNERIKKTNNVLDDIVIIDDGGFHTDEVNLIMRGDSFDLARSNIRDNIYFVNALILKDPKKNEWDHYKSERKLYIAEFPITYVSAGKDVLEYIKNNVPILYVERFENMNGNLVRTDPIDLRNKVKEYCASREDSHVIKCHFKSECTTLRPGSGLIAALAIAKLTEQLNVYGWDFYMDLSPVFLKHFQALKLFYNEKIKHNRDRFFEMSIIHWLYASRLRELNHVNINGHLNDVDTHSNLIKKINRVFYAT